MYTRRFLARLTRKGTGRGRTISTLTDASNSSLLTRFAAGAKKPRIANLGHQRPSLTLFYRIPEQPRRYFYQGYLSRSHLLRPQLAVTPSVLRPHLAVTPSENTNETITGIKTGNYESNFCFMLEQAKVNHTFTL